MSRRYLTEPAMILRLEAALEMVASVEAFAGAHGMTRQYVNAVLNGRRPMSDRLARAIGCERRVVYVTLNGKGQVAP